MSRVEAFAIKALYFLLVEYEIQCLYYANDSCESNIYIYQQDFPICVRRCRSAVRQLTINGF